MEILHAILLRIKFSSFNLGVFHNLMLGSARFLKLAALRPVLENYMRMLHAKVPVQRPGLQGIVGTLCLLPIKAADFSLGDFRKLGAEQYINRNRQGTLS